MYYTKCYSLVVTLWKNMAEKTYAKNLGQKICMKLKIISLKK